jgi:hypothetical protein
MNGAIPLFPLYAFVPWTGKIVPLSGAFAESRKVTVSFFMSVCPSVCPYGKTGFPKEGFPMKIDI